jgi:histone demethylase
VTWSPRIDFSPHVEADFGNLYVLAMSTETAAGTQVPPPAPAAMEEDCPLPAPSTSSTAEGSTPTAVEPTITPKPGPSTSQDDAPPPPTAKADPFLLSLPEVEMLGELTSRQFGYVRLDEEGNAGRKKTALKTVALLEQELARYAADCKKRRKGRKRAAEEEIKQERQDDKPSGSASSGKKDEVAAVSPPDPKIYRKLGHLHLLLENFTRALSAYEKYGEVSGRAARKDLDYLYGRGLVYFHFGAYHLACSTFQDLLYLSPNFEKAGDVHARLGLMRKSMQSFRRSLTHFKVSLRCCRSDRRHASPFSEVQVQFHMAHLHEVHGRFSKAMKMYRALLARTDLPVPLQSDVHRQMGWVLYSGRGGVHAVGEEDKNARVGSAIQHLQRSLELDPKSGQCLYLLGRCYASIGKVHEAFIAYRNSVDRSESNADTWCSIGVLYQQQNQPMDALQAYICAVQLEKYHGPAWTNLGMLYESTHQFQDALTCYTNAAVKCQYTNPVIQQRIKYLKAQLSNVMMPPPPGQQGNSPYKVKQLPAVEEAWNLPVSNEMTGRHPSRAAGKQGDASKRGGAGNDGKVAPLNAQQVQTLNFLQSQANLTPQQQHVLQQLQHQQNLFKQQQQQQQQAKAQQTLGNGSNDEGKNGVVDGAIKSEADKADISSNANMTSFAEDLLKEVEKLDAEKSEEEEGLKMEADDSNVNAAEGPTFNLMEVPTKLDKVTPETRLSAEVDMKGDDIVLKCKQWVKAQSPQFVPTAKRDLPPLPKQPGAKLSKEQLLPPTPSVHLENKKDAFSSQLQHWILEHPIAVIRGIAGALKLDLAPFSTRCVAETNPNVAMQVVTQVKQKADENWDASFSKQVWHIESKRSKSNIGDFSSYQLSVFQESLREEKASKGDYDELREDLRRNKKSQMYVQLGTCPDISDARLWKAQLTELLKLPAWARVVSGGNMLSHIGYAIPEANTVCLYMSVPHSRLGARQDVGNFSSVNINIGPGDCEWFAVPQEYWSSILALCEKHNVDFLHDTWWPNMKDLMEEDIPVYRFLQRPGDMVWVNAGCIYWVQSSGWGNSIKWNVGNLSTYQYQMALQKWRWNRLQFSRPVIPMVHLSWNLARNMKMSDEGLFIEVKKFLFESLKEFVCQREHLNVLGVSVSVQIRRRSEQVNFCHACEGEIFGLVFVEEEDGELGQDNSAANAANGEGGGEPSPVQTVCCFTCAKLKSACFKDIVCIEEQSLQELVCTYDNFRLQMQSTPQNLGFNAAAAAAFPNSSAAAAAAAAYAAAANAAMPFNNLLNYC